MKSRIRQIVREEIARMRGNKRSVNESKLLTEGTRSFVGYIDSSGNISSAYVHYDGDPKNMIPALKKHFRSVKDVSNLVRAGGATGIYSNTPVEYRKDFSYMALAGNVSNIDRYIKDAIDSSAEYIYLYNTRDRKWYYIDVYEDRPLKKLF